MPTPHWKNILLIVGILVSCGCSSLPNFKKVEYQMGAMSGYMGAMSSGMPDMAYSTQRMVNSAERMSREAEGILADLEKKSESTEKTAQKYLQAFVDNDRDVVNSLRGIHKELADLKSAIRKAAEGAGANLAVPDKALLAKLGHLEAQLEAAASRLEALDRSGLASRSATGDRRPSAKHN